VLPSHSSSASIKKPGISSAAPSILPNKIKSTAYKDSVRHSREIIGAEKVAPKDDSQPASQPARTFVRSFATKDFPRVGCYRQRWKTLRYSQHDPSHAQKVYTRVYY